MHVSTTPTKEMPTHIQVTTFKNSWLKLPPIAGISLVYTMMFSTMGVR